MATDALTASLLKTHSPSSSGKRPLWQTQQQEIDFSPRLREDLGGEFAASDTDEQADSPLSYLSSEELNRLAAYLRIPQHSASSMKAMQTYISQLHDQAGILHNPKPPRPLTLHRVLDERNESHRIYLDRPEWIEGEPGAPSILMGASLISNVKAYITKHPEVCFIICRDYASTSHAAESEGTDSYGNRIVKCEAESIIPVERHLVSAMRKFAAYSASRDSSSSSENEGYDDEFGEFSNDWLDGGIISLSSPYLPIYHARDYHLDVFVERLLDHESTQFRRVADYILKEYAAEYAMVDDLIAKSKITHTYLHYLFRPGIVLVQGRGAEARGYTCTSWLEASTVPSVSDVTSEQWMPMSLHTTQDSRQDNEPPGHTQTANEPVRKSRIEPVKNYRISAWHWDFKGSFFKSHTHLELTNISINDRSIKSINDLDLRPLEHADEETLVRLRTRGEWVWRCRKQRMIAYRDIGEKADHTTGERYMIDMKTYGELHSESLPNMNRKQSGNLLSHELHQSDDPPDNTFVYLSPPTMIGFNLKTKKWVDLTIDRFSEVQWNTGAFKSLVLHERTKRLIQALISNQIETELSTDIISGKGNGIIMLLHGGPGTGKTLTAESVAEIAKKPLYPVTCGDIGTEPRDVEKYLESVLHLGKVWGCVVLLDEADVFLEQRSLEDLKRNALVSVFLRVLEYYEGILILTSNRVGTFDEAFKSRIQLAIHYTSLTTHQKTKIWGNFLSRLKTLGEEGIDFLDLEDHIEELAQHKMNGREIRNVITTARQFARWERKQQKVPTFLLDYKVMKEIIETSCKFDRYIEKLNGGISPDQLAEDEGLRLAKDA